VWVLVQALPYKKEKRLINEAGTHNTLLKYVVKNAAGKLLAGFAINTRNCPLVVRYIFLNFRVRK
jgi:hypothetical protein